jgi:hypothetical protein
MALALMTSPLLSFNCTFRFVLSVFLFNLIGFIYPLVTPSDDTSSSFLAVAVGGHNNALLLYMAKDEVVVYENSFIMFI